jgi:probable F420-dependent oxidoreductase
MKFGIQSAPIETSMPVPDLAQAIEARGFDSYWVPEHTHIPVHHNSRYGGSADGALPKPFYQIHDPFIALATAAAATEQIKLGTAICLITQHEPIATAKTIASLDVLSGGRFIFGIGAGWFREEMEPMGTPYEARWQVTEERVRAMRALWTEDEAEFHGDHVDFPALISRPKPAQSGGVPVYIGAGSRWTPQRVVDYADGWLPHGRDIPALESGMNAIRELAPAAGRDPDSIPTTVFNCVIENVAEYERLGAERAIFVLPPLPADEFMKNLDSLASSLPLE